MRGFRNVGTETALMLAVVGGKIPAASAGPIR